jgi:hypothetical protein
MISLPFIIIQHAHFWSKHTLACSCLHIEQMHLCLIILLILFCCFDFSSAYNHSIIRGTPIAKKISIVRTGTRRTNNASPKHKAAIPKIEIQRVVGSIYTHHVCGILQAPPLLDEDMIFSSLSCIIRSHNTIPHTT